ncbi:hypothetical protein AMECASPLE_014043 [Ameca splendens]|uniref:Uncharacterized protein n=1 Tax=Ameca splendens TaxID=208324 RepID=A0ABV0YCG3_9TELE
MIVPTRAHTPQHSPEGRAHKDSPIQVVIEILGQGDQEYDMLQPDQNTEHQTSGSLKPPSSNFLTYQPEDPLQPVGPFYAQETLVTEKAALGRKGGGPQTVRAEQTAWLLCRSNTTCPAEQLLLLTSSGGVSLTGSTCRRSVCDRGYTGGFALGLLSLKAGAESKEERPTTPCFDPALTKKRRRQREDGLKT